MTRTAFPPVAGGYPFPALEREVLALWRDHAIFARTLAESKRREGDDFVFFEGPPTANNSPHVGHVVTRVVKDLFPRFQTMRGRHVARKAGWDTHGLAVEIEVEKKLGLSGKKDIEQLVPGDRPASIAKFNRACLESVMTYERQWRAMTERFGYWIDLDHAYFTYSNRYIESVWSALRRLHDEGLLYEGHKSQPYCARCGTTLSSHEVAQNYKDVDDPSIWVLFPVRPGRELATDAGTRWTIPDGLHLLAWTTTPWTMPGHAGIAVHPDFLYRVVEHPSRPGATILFADAIEVPIPCDVERDGKRERIDLRSLPAVVSVRGRELEGLRYDRPYRTEPADAPATTAVFDPAPSDEAGWPVVEADYVTLTDGTGLVHTAPAFGAEDHQTGLKYGLPLFRTVEPNGRIADRSGLDRLAGLWFKDADKEVVRDLRERGLMLHVDRYRHSYPFCWRCETPLLQYATESWFVRTTALREKLVAKNRDDIHWRPEAIGSGRFGNWLENVVDWALSRRRYWGTPLPIWKCDLCPAIEIVGSYEELFALSGIAATRRLLRPRAVRPSPSRNRRDHLGLPPLPGAGPQRQSSAASRTSRTPGSTPARCRSPSITILSRTPSSSRPEATSALPTSSPRRWTRPAAGSTRCTCWRWRSSTRSPSRTASCSATSTTTRGARCRSAWATSSIPWPWSRRPVPTPCAGTSTSTTRNRTPASRPSSCAKRRRASCSRSGTRCRSSRSTRTSTAGNPEKQKASIYGKDRISTGGSSCGSMS